MAGKPALSPLLLDTHAWVWWITRPEKLSRRQHTAIERVRRARSGPLPVSIISCWEVALLAHRRHRISAAVRLDALRDPADQLVVATALDRGARLVTSDARVSDSDLVAVVA